MRILTGKDKLLFERYESIVSDYGQVLSQLKAHHNGDNNTVKITRQLIDSLIVDLKTNIKGINDYLLTIK